MPSGTRLRFYQEFPPKGWRQVADPDPLYQPPRHAVCDPHDMIDMSRISIVCEKE